MHYLEIRDRKIKPQNFKDHLEALGFIELYLQDERIKGVIQRTREAYLYSFLPCSLDLLLKGDGSLEIHGKPASVYQAIGYFLYICNQQAEIGHALGGLVDMLPSQPKIKGYITAHEGGEFTFHDFFDTYEMLGFLCINFTPDRIENYKTAITQTPPEKFGKPIESFPGMGVLKKIEKVLLG